MGALQALAARQRGYCRRHSGRWWLLLCLLLVPWLPQAAVAGPEAAAPLVRVMTLDGPIGPAVSDWFVRALDNANNDDASLFVLELNTPGGLDRAMRDMIRAILESRVPVVTYVAPGGSRAASAGTYILYASHIAAMAPATNLGAATPVQVGGDNGSPSPSGSSGSQPPDSASALRHKQINDAVAYIRGLAQLRGRNQDWAEKAVRQAVSLPATDAKKLGVVDLIAPDLASLLQALEARTLALNGRSQALDLANYRLQRVQRDWRTDFLAIITNPSFAYLLLLAGIYGLILEFSSPGMTVPGVLGAICLLIGLYALQMLPISYVGLGLILLGAVLVVMEAFTPSFGMLGLGGVAAFVIGSVMLMDTDLPAFRIAMPVIAAAGVGSLLVVAVLLRLAFKAHARPPLSGLSSMVGEHAVALDDFDQDGLVRVSGEIWQAHSRTPVTKGQRLLVSGQSEMTLAVSAEQRASQGKEEI
ncbi:MAG: nodulation protein NfeD [Alcanivorax sp.]|nr:nodulation protein NfeD [Alcanivorax sp.]